MTTDSIASELRKTGVSVVGDVPWGTHFCYFYETTQDLLDLLIPYFKTGLEGNEFCLLIISNSELLKMDEATNALHGVLPDLDRYVARRSMEFVGHDAWFLNGGSFDFQRVANQFKEKVDEARARGFVGMRVSASPAWLETSSPKELRKFEAEVDHLYPRERIIAACTYPIGRSKADFLLEVARNHQFAIARRHGDWDIVETPELIQTKAEIKRLNDELEQRVIERTKKLEATTARLRAEIEERKKAEEAVRQSEERFVAFMDNLPGYAWMKDLQGRYVYVNKMVKGLPGYRSLGKTDAQIWPADLAAEYRANDEQVIATTKPLNTLENYFQLRGKRRYMAGNKFPIFDKTGAVALVGGVGVDITERIEAEAALRESEAKLKQAQQLANIGYWERDLIADRITWSKETGRILGLESRRGVLNHTQLREFVHPDDWQHHQQVLDEALRGKRLFDVEVRITRPDGSIRFVHIRDEIVRDESGKPIRMFGAVQDVTERRRAEEAVRESQQLVRLVLETLPVGVAVTNRGGDIVLVNAASKCIWGGTIVDGHERWGQTKGYWHDSGKRIAPESWASVRALSKGETSLNELIDIETYDGKRKTIHNSVAPIRNEEGLIVGAVVVNEDVTDRQQAEKKVREANDQLRFLSRRLLDIQEEERSHLARELHDEVGQALTAAKLNLKMIAPDVPVKITDRLDDSIQLLDRLLVQVRQLSLDLHPSLLDDLGLAAALRSLLDQQGRRGGLRTQFHATEPFEKLDARIQIAAFRIAQEAITNVLRHANAQFIRLHLETDRSELRMKIVDDGKGFDVATIERHAHEGAAFGLTGMKERTALAGGHIDISSAKGKGTTVEVSLPLHAARDETPSPGAAGP